MILVPAIANLQAVLDAATGGDVLVLEAGSTFAGVFELPENTSGQPITLTGSATLVSTVASQPVLKTRPRAHQWQLISGSNGPLTLRSKGASEILRIGTTNQTLDEMPCGIRIEGLRIEGDETNGAQRGISLNCGDAYIARNTIVHVRARNIESQGICGWNGTGPWTIEYNDIQAGGMPFMAGGAAISIPDVVPAGITFRHNHCHRPPEWQQEPFSCKNLFEIKNGRDVVVEDNLFEYTWEQGQRYAVALTPRMSGNTPWACVKGIRIRRNRFIHAPGGVNILGSDYYSAASDANFGKARSSIAEDIIVEDNQFLDIDTAKWGGHGSFVQLVRGGLMDDGSYAVPIGVVIRNNVVECNGNAIYCDSGPKDNRTPIPGVVFTGNAVTTGKIRGNGTGENAQLTVSTYLPASTITGNRLAAEPSITNACPDNQYYSTAQALQDEFMCWPGYRNLTLRPSARG